MRVEKIRLVLASNQVPLYFQWSALPTELTGSWTSVEQMGLIRVNQSNANKGERPAFFDYDFNAINV